jgi:methylenetetrahydrofolate dehydrogenase (NADP+)/methenyltetrahydrofolate cyclohydrolase/formyltetrahydrofolate synthetase
MIVSSLVHRSTFLPSRPLAELAGCSIKRIVWVSFGSTAESWFFAYEFTNDAKTFRLGESVPRALRNYVDNFGDPKFLEGTLRVQLGHDDSFVVWSRNSWACYGVPGDLLMRLCKLSAGTRQGSGIFMGSLKKGTLIHVQWSKDGSYYLHSSSAYARWFGSRVLREAWMSLWTGAKDGLIGLQQIEEIAVSLPLRV